MTARNLMGQIDGTAQPEAVRVRLRPADLRAATAGRPRPGWRAARTPSYAGSACSSTTGRSSRSTRRRTSSGGSKSDGAPLTGGTETTEMDLDKTDADGKLVIPINAHARITRPDAERRRRDAAPPVLLPRRHRRRTGVPDAGLLFVCWQADPLRGFVPVQRKLDRGDALSRVHPARVERPVRGAGRGGGRASTWGSGCWRGERPPRRARRPSAAIRVTACQPRYTYLGPEGTFTEVALRTLPEAATRELVPMVSVPAALDAVRNGEAAAALVPIENSVEGGITTTLDELVAGEPLMIYREVLLSDHLRAAGHGPARKLSDDQDGDRAPGRAAAGAQLDDGQPAGRRVGVGRVERGRCPAGAGGPVRRRLRGRVRGGDATVWSRW